MAKQGVCEVEDKIKEQITKEKIQDLPRVQYIYTYLEYDKEYNIPKEVLESENALVDEIKYLASPISKI